MSKDKGIKEKKKHLIPLQKKASQITRQVKSRHQAVR